jgi:hypothetical protein
MLRQIIDDQLANISSIANEIEAFAEPNFLANKAFELLGNSAEFRQLNEWSFLNPLEFGPTFNPENVIKSFAKSQVDNYFNKVTEQKEFIDRTLALKLTLEESNEYSDKSQEQILDENLVMEERDFPLQNQNLTEEEPTKVRTVSDDYAAVSDDELRPTNPIRNNRPEIVEINKDSKSDVINISNDNPNGDIIVTYGQLVDDAQTQNPITETVIEDGKNSGVIDFGFRISE